MNPVLANTMQDLARNPTRFGRARAVAVLALAAVLLMLMKRPRLASRPQPAFHLPRPRRKRRNVQERHLATAAGDVGTRIRDEMVAAIVQQNRPDAWT